MTEYDGMSEADSTMMGDRWHRWIATLAIMLLATAVSIAGAAAKAPAALPVPFALKLNGFEHTAWHLKDGAPGAVRQFAQTPDGTFYLGTSNGLFTFDGVAFFEIKAPKGSPMTSGNVISLFALPNNDLLVGYGGGGGAALLSHGKLVDLKMPTPPPVVTEMVATPDGAVWASYGGLSNRLSRYKDGRWIDAARTYRVPEGELIHSTLSPDGSLWLSLQPANGPRELGRQLVLRPGSHSFVDAGFDRSGVASFDRSGRLWSFGPGGYLALLEPNGARSPGAIAYPPILEARHVNTAFDAWGGIWGSTTNVGIFRIGNAVPAGSRQGFIERFDKSNGLSSDATITAFVDREGDIWVGTEGGLDRFRRTALTPEPAIPRPDSNGLAMTRSTDGVIHIVSSGQLYDVRPGQEPAMVRGGLLGNSVICSDRDGSIWLAATDRLIHRKNGAETAFPYPPGETNINNCGVDSTGHIWMLFGDIYRLGDDGWHHLNGYTSKSDIWDLAIGPDGDPYFSVGLRSLAHVKANRIRLIPSTRLKVGTISGLFSIPGELIVGGNAGVMRIRDGSAKWLDVEANPWARSLRGMVQTPDGKTWFETYRGIFAATTKDLEDAFGVKGRAVSVRTFDVHDGTETFAQKVGYRAQSLAAGGDGRLWYLRTDGAAYLDTTNIPINNVVPRVAVLSMTANGNVLAPRGIPVLPPGTRALDIAYAAYSLPIPDRVRFRYRMEGIDQDWIDPGSRRLASYSNLGPGRYVFHVAASNNDGVWNQNGASITFEIRPTFVQSWTFRLICILLLFAFCWLLYALRLRAISARLSAGFEAKMTERERIARELHDTLLQAVAALTLKVQAAYLLLPASSEPRKVLEDAMDVADAMISDGRARVSALRDSEFPADLALAIQESAARRVLDPSIGFDVLSEGRARRLVPAVIEEIVRIVNEALYNVATHARASRVEILLIHGRTSLTVVVRDDGIGFDAEVAARRQTQGHYGLQGMAERARIIRAKLSITRQNPGTEVRLRVPGAVAYFGVRRWRDFFFEPTAGDR